METTKNAKSNTLDERTIRELGNLMTKDPEAMTAAGVAIYMAETKLPGGTEEFSMAFVNKDFDTVFKVCMLAAIEVSTNSNISIDEAHKLVMRGLRMIVEIVFSIIVDDDQPILSSMS